MKVHIPLATKQSELSAYALLHCNLYHPLSSKEYNHFACLENDAIQELDLFHNVEKYQAQKNENNAGLPKGFYEIEDILGQKTIKGVAHILIKWKGYEVPTYEPETSVQSFTKAKSHS